MQNLTFYADQTEVLERARTIRLLVLDVDGVLTRGQLYFTDQGETLKAFNTLDGHGIKMLQASGIRVAIISGRQSAALTLRATALGVTLIKQGREDKLTALQELLADENIPLSQIACMGDDLPDLAIMSRCQLSITVPNANDVMHSHAHLCSGRHGGEGAVREIADFLLHSQGYLDGLVASYLPTGQHQDTPA